MFKVKLLLRIVFSLLLVMDLVSCMSPIKESVDSKINKQYTSEDLEKVTTFEGTALLNKIHQLQNEANQYYIKDQHFKALEVYKTALHISGKIGDFPSIAENHEKLGNIYKTIGDYPIALEHHQTALNIRKKVNTSPVILARGYDDIGRVYSGLGNYSDALKKYQISLDIRKKTGNKSDIENSYLNMARTFDAMHDYPNSLKYYKKVLNTKEKIEKGTTAEANRGIGSVYLSMKKYSEALRYHKIALRIWEEENNTMMTAQALGFISGTYKRAGDYPAALKWAQNGLNIAEKLQDKLIIALNHFFIAEAYRGMQHNIKALKHYQDTLKIYKEVFGIGSPSVAIILGEMAKIYQFKGNYSKSYFYVKQAFQLFLTNRKNNFIALSAQQKNDYLQSHFSQNSVKNLFNYSALYLLNLQKNGQQAEAKNIVLETINHWLAYKGSIIDSENRLLAFAKSNKDKKIKQQYQQLIQLKKQYARQSQNAATAAQKKQLGQQKQAITTLQYKIAKQDPRFQKEQASQNATVENIAAQLKPNELYLDYGNIDGEYYIFSISSNDTKANMSFNKLDNKDSKTIDQLIKSFNNDIQHIVDQDRNPDQLKVKSQQTLAKLYDLLIANTSFNAEIKNKTSLIISPDGALRLLPFEALYDAKNKKYLIEQKQDIRYIASGRELVRAYKQRNKRPKSQKATLFANPDFGSAVQDNSSEDEQDSYLPEALRSMADFPVESLPGTEDEAIKIKTILPSTRDYQGKQASETRLLKVKSPKILHIATHGFFNGKSIDPMLQSGILLAGANHSNANQQDEGIVTALKLSGMNLEGTDLVVLSACETGKVDPNNTEGISGLTKAFIQAGAKDVIMTLWQIDDIGTVPLIERFYQKVKANNGKYAESLRQSKLEMLEQHPYYWAGFVLSGL